MYVCINLLYASVSMYGYCKCMYGLSTIFSYYEKSPGSCVPLSVTFMYKPNAQDCEQGLSLLKADVLHTLTSNKFVYKGAIFPKKKTHPYINKL